MTQHATPIRRSTSPAEHSARGETPVIVTQGLTKVFKDFWMRPRARAVDNLDMVVWPGEIFGLLGPNGSGKSTTIKILLGLLHKTSGFVAVFGKPPSDVEVKKRIGVLPEESHLYPFLNAYETLDYYGKLFGLDHAVRNRRIGELLEMVGLQAVAHRQVNEYSKGMRRRIGIAQALINDPELLILDEPTSGLDPIGARQVKDLILELGRRGKTVLLSSHLLADVEDVVDRMIILYGGRKRAEGTCDELLTAAHRVTIETDAIDDEAIQEIEQTLARRGGGVRSVSRPRQRLEDLFMDIVERARAERITTSGAQEGAGTASFLRAQTEEGGALIDRLTAERRDEPAPAPPSEEQTPSAPDVVESLMASSEEPAPPRPGAAETDASEPSRESEGREEGDADDNVISALLGEEDRRRGPGDGDSEDTRS